MQNRFLCLAKAEIHETIHISDSILDMNIDPVYEDGLKFSGQVLMTGELKSQTDKETLAMILKDYLTEYVDFAFVQSLDIRSEQDLKTWQALRYAS